MLISANCFILLILLCVFQSRTLPTENFFNLDRVREKWEEKPEERKQDPKQEEKEEKRQENTELPAPLPPTNLIATVFRLKGEMNRAEEQRTRVCVCVRTFVVCFKCLLPHGHKQTQLEQIVSCKQGVNSL